MEFIERSGKLSLRISLMTLALFVIAGCGTSETYHKVTTEQANEAWQPVAINTIAVIAITEDRGKRVGSETVFADHLKERGMNVVASYEIFPDLDAIDTSDEAIAAFAERNTDAALTIAIAESAAGYDRDAYWAARGWSYLLGSDSRAWGDLADMSSYGRQGEHSLDIGLWDVKSMQAIWHAQTDSNEWDEGSAGVARLADAIADMLVQRGFVEAK